MFNLTRLLQTLTDALSLGSLYALIAIGYTMVYGVLRLIGIEPGAQEEQISLFNANWVARYDSIIAVDTDHTVEQPCIKCGRCMDVCPMELSPLYFAKFADEQNWQGMKDKNVMDCIECRCCEYICSSKIPLVTKIKAGKNAVRGMK